MSLPAAAARRSRLCVAGSSRATRCSRTARRPRGSSPVWSSAAAKSSSAKKGLPSERATIASVSAADGGASAWAASSAASSSRWNGPSSSTSAEPERRTRSASRRMRSAEESSSARKVASSRTRRPWRLCARKTTRSSVEVSAQCRSSSTSSRGAAAARSNSSASVSWNTRSCEPAVRPSTRGNPPSGPTASTNGWYGSSVPTRSIERPRRTSNPAPRARAASSVASRVLPMPASPPTRAVVPVPAWAASRARPSCPSPRPRPTSPRLAPASIREVSRRRQRRGRRAYASRDGRLRTPAGQDTPLPTDAPRPLPGDDPVEATDTRRREMTAVAQPASLEATRTHTVRGGGGLRLHVREWGRADGPPILFIHGWSQSHLCWARQYRSGLAGEFRLVAYDLRGHGMSEAPPGPEHYTDGALWADDLAAVIDQLGLDRPVLVGWSYGGFIICDYLRAHGQDRVGAIAFVAAAVRLGPAAFGTLIGPGFLDHFADATADDLPTNIRGMRGLVKGWPVRPYPPEEVETLLCSSMAVPARIRANLAAREIDGDDVLRALKVPVL